MEDNWRSFITNSDGCIVLKRSGKGPEGQGSGTNFYFYAEKEPGKIVLMAYYGDIKDTPEGLKRKADEPRYKPIFLNIDTNHQPISSHYPPQVPSSYTTPRAMTYDEIAEELDRTGYGPDIAFYNGADASQTVLANYPVHIPPLNFEVRETAWNGPAPAVESILGSLYPSLPMPALKYKDPEINWVEVALETAVLVAIMAAAPALIAGMYGLTLGAGASAAATTGGAATIGASAAGATVATPLQAAAIYGASAAIASSAAQGVGMAFGKGFDVKAVAANTIASAVSAGVLSKLGALAETGPIMQNFQNGTLAGNIANAEAVALAQQAVLMAANLQKRFDWKGLAAAAFTAAAGTATANIENDVIKNTVTATVLVKFFVITVQLLLIINEDNLWKREQIQNHC